MFRGSFFSLKKFDWILLAVVILLICFGLAVQYSLNLETGAFSSFNKQLIFAIVGLALLFLITFVDYRNISKLAFMLYALSIVLLLAVLIFGQTLRGTKGWLFGFQVVEFAKIALVLALAKYWSVQKTKFQGLKSILIGSALLIPPILLTLLQPDFGSALVLVVLGLFLILLVDRCFKNFIKIIILLILIAISAWFFVLQDYQKDRVLTLINPQRDPFGSGYQVAQSVIAVGSGQFLGRGFGLGSQSQLKFLPEAKTDFVFSVIAEELGFVSAFLVLVLYFILFWRMFKIIKSTYDDFSSLAIFGIGIIFFVQIIINIGMNLGIAPITGIPLPFLSYGGSSLIMSLIAVGIVESVAMHQIR